MFDVMIIDTGVGIADSVIHFNLAADEIVIVTSPEPHAMTDAYAMIKILCENHGRKQLKLLVNMTQTQREALKVFEIIAEVARRFLKIEIGFAGYVPFDPQVQKSVAKRQAASADSTFTIAGQAWAGVMRSVYEGKGRPGTDKRDCKDVWRELVWSNEARAVLG